MAKKPKSISMAKAARIYKRNTKPSGDITTLSKRTQASGAVPSSPALRKPDVKHKAKSVTLGGSRGNKGATIKKTGRV